MSLFIAMGAASIRDGADVKDYTRTLAPSDIACLQYTGGTTGVSKGAMLTHRNLVANVLQAEAWMKPWISSNEEVVITALPLYHIFALTANCLVFVGAGGHNVLITNPRDFKNFVAELKKFA